ncbi:putative endonuclease [Bacillus pakistanensis]|uniref:Endonuclease n=1 Tax=Rossellomorea pakistanensis TaxID=992288 RepID=A0ABS2NJZ5_9BACI|nr:GIY-YIG nuclease family protein [Bacillus pakistanensis]MBM7588171.1 putative endonuclease [Bacillus pakistanensis]
MAKSKETHIFYVLECKDGSYYGGYTTNIDRRIKEHNEGKGAKYTRARKPVELVHSRGYSSKREAMQAEYAFKQLSRIKKEQFLAEMREGEECAPTEEFSE